MLEKSHCFAPIRLLWVRFVLTAWPTAGETSRDCGNGLAESRSELGWLLGPRLPDSDSNRETDFPRKYLIFLVFSGEFCKI
jgi:hypothetical protein